MVEKEPKGVCTNAAVLLDRDGKVAGIYRKVYPVAHKTDQVLEGGVAPGKEFPVFECDFGRLGIQICFDYAYEDGWETLARKGAEIVAWPSQSPQTVRPAGFARRHRYYLVSSTWRDNASIFEPTGRIAAQIRDDGPGVHPRVLVHQLDLSYVLLPWQPPLHNGDAMRERYGDRVGYHYSRAEDVGLFWSNDPKTPVRKMVREMGFQEEHELFARSRAMQEARRGGPPDVR
jgi:predicted amidohydrolase